MNLTPHSTLRRWLLIALGEGGGVLTKGEALASIEARHGHLLTPDDHLSQPSNGEIKWRNRCAFERDTMVKVGLLAAHAGYNRWALTDEGWAAYRALATPVPVDPATLWAFTPKDDAEYVAHVAGMTLVKSRAHETLVNDYAAFAAAGGFGVASPHPRDLTLRRGGVEYLVEAKVVGASPPTASRHALAQLFDYRHFLYDPGHNVGLVALFDRAVGAYGGFLAAHDVAVVWREGSGWRGDATAARAGLTSE